MKEKAHHRVQYPVGRKLLDEVLISYVDAFDMVRNASFRGAAQSPQINSSLR